MKTFAGGKPGLRSVNKNFQISKVLSKYPPNPAFNFEAVK